MHFAARLSRTSKAAGTVSVNRNVQPQELMVGRNRAAFGHSLAMVVLLLRLITAAVTISLARWVGINQCPGRLRVRLHTAAAINTALLVQAIPLQISAEWVRLAARHRCHTTAHRRLRISVRQLLPISVHRPLRTIARREGEVVAVARLAVAVRLMLAVAGILLRVAIAAAEGHSSSLKPLRLG